jgi:hypothetical protein
MINNIGFNENATHTSQAPHIRLSNIKVFSLNISNGILKGKMHIDCKYEIVNVAEYWNGVVINYYVFINKFKKDLKKRLKNIIINA